MDEGQLDDYAFAGLDPFVQTVFSELMEHSEGCNIASKRSSGSMTGKERPYFRVLENGDVSFVFSELSKEVLEYEMMHVRWLIAPLSPDGKH